MGGKLLLKDIKMLNRTGANIPSIGLGTWGIGGYGVPDHSKDKDYIAILKKAMELGLRLIDTAEYYGGGHTEELVGEAIKEFPRDEVFIITKVWGTNLRHDDLIRAAIRSLKRLQTNYIDLYLVHWRNYSIPLKETMKAMERLIDRGIVTYIGVSNFEVPDIEEARYELSKYDIVANEVKYSILDRSAEKEILPYCQREGITLIAYTPLEKGRVAKEAVLTEVGRKYGKTAVQVALNWLISKDVVVAIPKASREDHLVELVGSMNWRLSESDINYLNRVYS
jgi:diketogulonate reductase-like aldo/keto reductase